jgi:hypothetical protein
MGTRLWTEIKLAIMLLISHNTLTLVGDSYEVVDPLNVTSVAPRGQVIFSKI